VNIVMQLSQIEGHGLAQALIVFDNEDCVRHTT
jgi:hypothetical protein